ncbi:hypothetical protein ACFU7Y_32205 [Kitasatospora sp. NPDC057542]|uniref:hypothetical protein n=1 Tax=Kitasatospora sp. NPDC057542 TaxID=3346162 RepID=UPI0036C88A55
MTVLVCVGSVVPAVTGWGGTPAEALLAAVLGGLRGLSAAGHPAGAPSPRGAVGAAGPSELCWLLDGALALLARQAVPLGGLAKQRALRSFRSRPGREATLPGLAGLHVVPGLADGWAIARVVHPDTRRLLAAEWGASPQEALGYAATRAQWALAQPEPSGVLCRQPPSATRLLTRYGGADLPRLAGAVLDFLRPHRLRLLGIRMTSDSLLGPQAVAWGPVWLG